MQEAPTEGVNHDLAFCQMCLETNYLYFGGAAKPEQFNFGDMGIISPTNSGISFPHARTEIRAQIQHLKAYGSTQPINQPLVQENVRFRFVKRSLASTVNFPCSPLEFPSLIRTKNHQYHPAFVRTQNLCRVRTAQLDLVLR